MGIKCVAMGGRFHGHTLLEKVGWGLDEECHNIGGSFRDVIQTGSMARQGSLVSCEQEEEIVTCDLLL
eukprot:scaffold7123_cov134-Skeletonema_menzelii.AAC.4